MLDTGYSLMDRSVLSEREEGKSVGYSLSCQGWCQLERVSMCAGPRTDEDDEDTAASDPCSMWCSRKPSSFKLPFKID